MKSLKEAVIKLGATEQQCDSKIFHMVEQAIEDDAVDGLADARQSVSKLQSQVKYATEKIRANYAAATRLNDGLGQLVSEAREAMSELESDIDDVRISDQGIRDAVNAYTLILSRTKSVLGDDALTEPVLIQLLETASYGLWRSIMGPKEQPKPGRVIR